MIKKMFASLSSILAALLASSCCWLPFVLLAFGVSGGAIAAKISAFRPLFLLIAGAALWYSIHLYVKKRKQTSCCGEGAKKGFDWHLLSLVFTTLIVIAIAAYPLYYGLLPNNDTVATSEQCDSSLDTESTQSTDSKDSGKKSCCP